MERHPHVSLKLLHSKHRLLAIATAVVLGVAALFGAGAVSGTATASAQPTPVASNQFGSSQYLDELGRPTPYLQDRVQEIAALPFLPQELSDALLSGLAFATGAGEVGGPPLPEDAPVFTQFYWPTVSGDCIGGQLDATGSALAVPGPAEIPAPGAADGQTAFLFTALGTAPAAEQQGGMNVYWFNLDTFAFGETPLENNGINPEGPATVSGVADTGKGTILAALGGDVRTTESTCSFLPTAAVIEAK